MKYSNDLEEKMLYLQKTDKPVVIWGTTMAGQMAYQICNKMNIEVNAFGDNNEQKQGMKLFDVEILSADMICQKYSNAVIIIGSFLYDIKKSILRQLSSIGDNFSFVDGIWIEYYYEFLIMERNVSDRELFLNTLTDIEVDENAEWRFLVNRKVIFEYRYIVCDYKCDDLLEILDRGYQIKYLCLIVSVSSLNSRLVELVRKIQQYSNIGHIILVTDGKGLLIEYVGRLLRNCFFYIRISLEYSNEFLHFLELNSIYVEMVRLPEGLFNFIPKAYNIEITENKVREAVYAYTNRKLERKYGRSDKKVYIVQLFNGLANQMLMCLFGKMLEIQSGRTVIFDDTVLSLDVIDRKENINRISQWFVQFNAEEIAAIVDETRKRNSFYCYNRAEVAEVFSTPICLLSDYFDMDTWSVYLEKVKMDFSSEYRQAFPLGQLLLAQGIDIAVMQDKQIPPDYLVVKNCFIYDTQILELPYRDKSATQFIISNSKNTYYMGVWTMGRVKDWLYANRKFVRRVYTFDTKCKEKNLDYIEIIRATEAVMLHVRRGDFLLFNTETDDNYFRLAIQKIEKIESRKQKHYFIFSDDIDWCKSNSNKLGLDTVQDKVSYVTGNNGKDSYMDMYLMSLGKILVPSNNSTFSYLALLISESIEKCVDAIQYEFYSKLGIYDRVEIVEINEKE